MLDLEKEIYDEVLDAEKADYRVALRTVQRLSDAAYKAGDEDFADKLEELQFNLIDEGGL